MVDGTRQKVLVVDDEELVRNVCAAMLHNFGYEVLTSSGGVEGLQTFRENSDDIALVVSDIVMPDFSGPEMVRAMTKERSDLKVVFMSGFEASNALPSGLHRYQVVLKPFSADQLVSAVERVLNPQKGLRVNRESAS